MKKLTSIDTIPWNRYPGVATNPVAKRWLELQVLLGLATNTIDAYGRALQDFLAYCQKASIEPAQATRDQIAQYVGDLRRRPNPRGAKILNLDSGAGLSNATLQQRVTAVRLFFDHLVEEGQRDVNPVGRGRYTPGKAFGGKHDRGLVRRFQKLPWIPTDEQWQAFLVAAQSEPIRNRCMIGLAYDAGLRREELCTLQSDDLDPAHRTLRIRAETTKGGRERIVPYSAATGALLKAYLAHRHVLGSQSSRLFLSEAHRNRAAPITLWTWSKVIRRLADRAQLPRFSTHTLRHLCLTDLARAGWELHEIACFAGHRNLETTQQYIHLSGRDLAERLARGMNQIHTARTQSLADFLLEKEGDPMTSRVPLPQPQPETTWTAPLDLKRYDRSPRLSANEQRALQILVDSPGRWGDPDTRATARLRVPLGRLLDPLQEVMVLIGGDRSSQNMAMAALLRACQREHQAFWGWPPSIWIRVLGRTQSAFFEENGPLVDGGARQYLIAAAYLFGCFREVRALGHYKRVALATKVFGRPAVDAALKPIEHRLSSWGYSAVSDIALESTVCEALLLNQSPRLEDLTLERLDAFRRGTSLDHQSRLLELSKALAANGLLDQPLPIAPPRPKTPVLAQNPAPTEMPVSAEWLGWVRRWEETSTLEGTTRRGNRGALLKAGHWLAACHPTITSPAQWDRELGILYVAALDRMRVGDYVTRRAQTHGCGEQPLSPRTKNSYLSALRVFFRDCQEWGWIPLRFDPWRVFATPRSIKALIGPAPRTIAADTWARLVWAGLHLTAEDLRGAGTSLYYPLEMLQALAAVWLFAGLRSDEITRLRVGCVRWQSLPSAAPAVPASASPDAVCMLDIPVHKTGTAFTKPVDALVGRAIATWETVRPAQPWVPDRKTGERVSLLFCYRARPLPRAYLNGALIPMLCRKAGVAAKDGRGAITSHRARATIASQLFNAREPMTLDELQAWLGHRSPATTQHYVALEPTRLARAYDQAGYFARNRRAIEVLIDQDAIKSAAVAAGAPWRYYDLGHGLCTYEFFEQCPHRMACPRCDFYHPKDSGRGQLVEAKTNLLRLLQEMPVTDEERAAIDGDLAALDRLVARLADQPTPSGPTPQELRGCVKGFA